MAEIRTVTTLRYKRTEIIAPSELRKEARVSEGRPGPHNCGYRDLRGVRDREDIRLRRYPPVLQTRRDHGHMQGGPLNTRQLAPKMAVKGFDTGDKVLAKAVEHRLPRRSHNSQCFRSRPVCAAARP